MKLKRWFLRYTYLVRITCTLFMALCIPLMFMGFLLSYTSYQEMCNTTKSHYVQAAHTIAENFQEQTASMTAQALQIGIEHKLSRRVMESHPWKIVEASQLLSAYNAGFGSSSDLGIFFPGTDYIVTTQYKYSLSDCAQKYAYGSATTAQKIEQFFREMPASSRYLSTAPEAAHPGEGVVFFSVPIHLSSSIQKDAVILFFLDRSTLTGRLSGALETSWYQLDVFDQHGQPFLSTNEEETMEQEDFGADFLSDHHAQSKVSSTRDAYIYKVYDPVQMMTFAISVHRDLAEKNLFAFYTTLQTIMLFSCMLIFAVLIPTIHLNYRPILSLLRKVQKSGEAETLMDGELRTIERTFEKISLEKNVMSKQADEQNLALTDYLLHRLLGGDGLSDRELESLHMLPDSTFCAATVLGMRLEHRQRESIEEAFFDFSRGRVYIVDMPHEQSLVFLCIVPKDAVGEDIREALQKILVPLHFLHFGMGNLVPHPQEIHTSYINALCDQGAGERATYYNEYTDVVSQTACYPLEAADSFLQYLQCANETGALDNLHKIIRHISQQSQTFTFKRYLCSNLLNEYLKTLYKMGMTCGFSEVTRMVNFGTLEEFGTLLCQSTQRTCACIAQKRQSANDAFNKSIVDYIDQNYQQETISLVQVADTFHISIYTLSRIFKEETGSRFKEYITKRRLEYGKHLLLTTDSSIKKIAEQVGLSNADYFTKLFKERYQLSPSKLREG